MKKNVNIYDIAKAAGVSITTVSRAINSPELLKPSTRERIEEVMRELEYAPNALAQSLVSKSTKTIGVIIANINNPFYGEMVRSIEAKAAQEGYTIILGNTGARLLEEEKYIDIFQKKQVDAMIFAGGRSVQDVHNEHVRKLSKVMPVVLTNHYMEGSNIYSILTDEGEGTRKAIQYLIDKGHREIAYINGYEIAYPSVIKRENMMGTLERNGLRFDEDLEIGAEKDDIEGGFNACCALIERGKRFSALFAANDLMAIGAMKALQKAGIRVPEDVAVVGYDDIYLCRYCTPELTSVTQNIGELGRCAVECVARVLEGKMGVEGVKRLRAELVVRGSV